MTALSGVWAASLTPLDDDLAPDVGRLTAHIKRLFATGCDGVVLFGTTGEAASFSVDERRNLLDGVVESAAPPSPTQLRWPVTPGRSASVPG